MIVDNGKEVKVTEPLLLKDNKDKFDLTLVVPAYNEENRLPKMMLETTEVYLRNNSIILQYLKKEYQKGMIFKKPIEIMIVDDGSSDKTLDLIVNYSKEFNDASKGIIVRGFIQKQN